MVTIVFYVFLLFAPNNKAVIGLFFLLFIFYSYHLKSVVNALLISYVTSWTVLTGKAFEMLLIPKELLSVPWDYKVFLIASAQFLFGVIIVMEIIINHNKYRKEIVRNKSLIAFLLFITLSATLSRLPTVSLFYSLNYISLIGFFLIVMTRVKKDKRLPELIIATLLGLGVIQSILSAWQFLKKSSFGSPIEAIEFNPIPQGVDVDPFGFRAFGTFSHPNELSFFILPLFVYVATFVFRKNPTHQEKIFTSAGIILLLLPLFTTKTRATWIVLTAFVIVVAMLLYKKYKLVVNEFYLELLKRVAIILLPALVIIIVPRIADSFETFNPGGSASTRISQMREAVGVFSQKPLFGTGLGLSVLEGFLIYPVGQIASAPSPVHMIYLHLLVEAGALSFLSLGIFVIMRIKTMIGRLRKGEVSKHQLRLIAYLFATLVLLVNGLFQPIMEVTFKPLILFLALAEQS